MIIDRENEIKNFQPEEYWTIEGTFEKEKSFDALYYGNGKDKIKLTNEAQVKAILKDVKGTNFDVVNVTKRNVSVMSHQPLQHHLYSRSRTKIKFPC